MDYQIPAPLPDAKLRFVRVTDAAEIAAIQRGCMADPVGAQMGEDWYAEWHSLQQFRKVPVEIEV